jgi:hypothetical protein
LRVRLNDIRNVGTKRGRLGVVRVEAAALSQSLAVPVCRGECMRLHARGEDGIARLGGVATVTQLVRQTGLPSLGVAMLGAVEIGDPNRRAMTGHHLGDDAGTTAAADHMDHHLVVLEHPVPAGAAVDAHAGLVRADHPGPAQAGQDGRGLGVEAGLAALEGGIEGTLADGEAEQLEHQPAEPAVADVVDEAQVHRQRDDVQAEWCARLQPLRQRGEGGAAAAAAVPGVALHPRHHRHDLRQVDLVEAAGERQVGLGQRRLALRTAGRTGGDGLVRHLG